MRLQKILQDAGVSSRRGAVSIIEEGRVTVNGVKILEPGYEVSGNETILLDGEALQKEQSVYYLVNKPSGVMSQLKDDKNRKTISNLLDDEAKKYRLFPAIRLDYDTAGLLILSNDGMLSNQLSNPNIDLYRIYMARLEGLITKEALKKIKSGIKIAGHWVKPTYIKALEYDGPNQSCLVQVVLTEGKNPSVRALFESVGYPVKNLTLTGFGDLTLQGVERGSFRKLSIHEVKKLYGTTKKS